MRPKLRLPFKGVSAEGWQNLALLALAVFYLTQFALDLSWHNVCGRLAIDYCSFWSAGHIAATSGYSQVYDLSAMQVVERSVFPARYEVGGVFETVPTPYLPLFILPFTLLSGLDPSIGYWFWTVLNLVILLAYVSYFARATTGKAPGLRLLVFLTLAFPTFLNFFYGQVNVLMLVVVGEYMRAAISGKPFRAGLWLGALLIKPQYLVLVGIALLMQRSVRTLAGLAACSLAVFGISYALIGSNGVVSLVQLWLGYTSGLPATGPSVMMNWRMIGIFLSAFFGPTWIWALIFCAMLVTALAGLYLWRRPVDPASPSFAVVVLGTFAATGMLAWHSHISSAMILIPPLIHLRQPGSRLPRNAFELWVLIPPGCYFVTLVLAALLRSGTITASLGALENLLSAISPFIFNLYFLGWALQTMGGAQTQSFPASERTR